METERKTGPKARRGNAKKIPAGQGQAKGPQTARKSKTKTGSGTAAPASRRRAAALSVLQETMFDISMRVALPDLLNTLVERAAKLLHADSGGLYLAEPKHRRVRCVVSYNTAQDFRGAVLAYGEGAAGLVAETGQPLKIDDYSIWPGRAKIYEGQRPFRAVISAPIIWQGRVTGVVHILRVKKFAQADLDLLILLANQAAVAVENARLYDSAAQELSERKHAEASLRESEAKYRTLAEAAGDMIYVIDAAQRIQYVNQFVTTRLGRSQQALVNASLADVFGAEAADQLSKNLDQVIRSGKTRQYESYLPMPNGATWVNAILTPIKDDAGRVTSVLGISRDITERKEAEKKLRESEALYRRAIEVAGAVPHYEIYSGDRKRLHYDFIGDGIRQITGYGPEEFTSELWDALVQEAHPVGDLAQFSFEEAIQRVRTGEYPIWKCEFRIRARDGKERWVFESAVELRDENGVLHGSIGIYQDITERKQAEQSLRNSEQRARELFDIAQRQAQELGLLDKVRNAMAQEVELTPLLRRVVESISETFGYTLVSLYLLEGEEETLQYQVGYDRILSKLHISQGIIGRVTRTGQPVLVEDVRADPTFLDAIEGIVSEICVPLLDNGKVAGVLNVESTHGLKLTNADLELMNALSVPIGLAIGRARMYEDIQRRNQILSALQESTFALMKNTDLSETLQTIMSQAARLVHTEHGYLYLVQPEENILQLTLGVGIMRNYQDRKLKLGEGLAGKVWQTTKPLNVREYQEWSGRSDQFADVDIHAIIGVPLIYDARVIGILGLIQLDPEREFSDNDVELLTYFARLASIALNNADLFTRAQQELFERRQTEENLLAATQKLETLIQVSPLPILMADIAGNIQLWNPAAERTFGWTAEEVIGRPNPIIFSEKLDEYAQLSDQIRLGSSITDYETVRQRKDGEQVDVSLSTAPLFDNAHNVIGRMAILADITERKRAEKLQRSMYEIARAAMTVQSLDELYSKIHDVLRGLLPTQHFYIALYDRKNDLLSFPYFQDAFDTATPPGKPRRGLTEYVLRTRQPLLATQSITEELVRSGEIELIGADSIEWLGVPLIAHDDAIGVMVVQSYDEAVHFSPRDVEVMTYVSTQVASAIERKRAEQALKESEQRFHSLFDNATVGMYRTTLDGRILLSNPASVRMLGYDSFEDLARRDLETGEAESIPPRHVFIERMKREGMVIGMENAWKRKDGSFMYVRESAAAVRDESGNILYFDGTFEDITARKQAEQKLLESEERYRTIFEDSPVRLLEEDFSAVKKFIDELHARGEDDLLAYFQEHPEKARQCVHSIRLVNVNKAVLRWYQIDHVSGADMRLVDLIGEDDYESVLQEIIALSKNQTRYEIEVNRLAKNGTPTHLIVTGTIAPGYEDSWARVLISALDITDLKRAEEALKRSEAFSRSIVENEPECVKIIGPGGILRYMNPAGLDMIEVDSLERVINKPVYSIIPPEYRQAFVDLTERVLRGERGALEFEMVGLKGTRRWLDTHAVPLFDEHGNVTSLLGITRDITERKQAEALQDVVYRIAKAAETSPSLNDLFPQIHQVISSVMSAGNFFITLYDETSNTLQFPYFRDELDEPFMGQIEPGKGLTAYVLRTGQSLLCTQAVHDELERQGAVLLLGEPSKIWLGVPLIIEGKAIGAMVVQHYTDPEAYGPREQHILEFISAQVAITIRRKQAEEALRASEERYRSLFNDMLDGIYRSTHNGRFVDVNPAMLRLFGFGSREEMLAIDIRKDLYFAPEERESLFLDTGQEKVDVFRMKRKDGSEIWVEDHGRYIHDDRGAVVYHEGILRDVTERIHAESEINRLLHESQQRLRQVEALRSIDLAIGSSMDLRTTLTILLSYIKSLLAVDAADILLFNVNSQSFEFAAGNGYRGRLSESALIPMGHSFAGQVALERRMLQFTEPPDPLTDRDFYITWKSEGFSSYTGIPLIAKGELKGVLEVYHRSAFQPDAPWADLLQNFSTQAAIAIDNAQMFNDLQRSNFELSLAYDATIEGWSRAQELRDYGLEGHFQRLADLTLGLARAMGLRDTDMVHIRRGALLHDIGKMGIPDSILLKPGPLTDEEWNVVYRHPGYANDLLTPITYLRPALDIPYCHHERWDGRGYPRGLKGEEIPPAARIFAVVDVFDAMTSDRPYRKRRTKEEAIQYIENETGKHFDPKVADAFLRLEADGLLNL